ncbi:serine hydrolase domain-containing protein [Brachybacterium avium]|uniref:serine hydrolase domain-containing protein n=1 Tax=Brachybacterium avium TaxID=2017485 RepID=UPI0012FE1D1E|nr:serine hydrolase domain-containing protein [Brachybacterium avium]
METDRAPEIPVDVDFAHALGVTDAETTLHTQGEQTRVWDLASVSKPLTALGVLIAVDRGLVDLEEPAGPEGATVRHLLAHTAGYAFDGDEVVGGVGARRIYSNTGFEVLAAHVEEATGFDFVDWMEQTVVAGLDLVDLEVTGSPAAGYRGSLRDLLTFGRELLAPTLIPEELWREARTVQFPGLAGILPGYGRQKPNDWGLGFEIRDGKQPHWTGAGSSPETFGHFGQSGSFLWVDPVAGLAAAFLGEQPFGPEHVRVWPGLTDALLERFGDAGHSSREHSSGGAR